MIKIGIDLMGGDYAPQNVLEGILLYQPNLSQDIGFTLFGTESLVENTSKDIFNKVLQINNVEFIETSEVIEMGESPTKAFAKKQDSSIVKGFTFLKANQIDAFISAGNTGAMLVSAMQVLKAIEGVIRPTITSVIPKENGGFGLLVDVGFNPDCRQDVLYQFGLLGSLYMKHVFNVENPKVGLLNIGSEKEKGNLISVAAHALMENTDKYNFIGNIEGYDLFSDKADVIVSDGFVGNVVLKTLEGFYKMVKKNLNGEIIDAFNYENYGGTPILGVTKPVLIGHGVSSSLAFKSMVSLAISLVESNLIEKIKDSFLNYNNNI